MRLKQDEEIMKGKPGDYTWLLDSRETVKKSYSTTSTSPKR
jgi:hypothetical protein